jgi:hypothetical protein
MQAVIDASFAEFWTLSSASHHIYSAAVHGLCLPSKASIA